MKYIETDAPVNVRENMLNPGDRFSFKCYPGISCFNRCCRNLNLFLYPYDIIRLKQNLGMTSAMFIDQHTDVVIRPGNVFPDVMLKMAENSEKTCPFLTGEGCSVYPDRPQTCRTFPLEYGLFFDAGKDRAEQVVFFRPPDFCMGRHESTLWTRTSWEADQNAAYYNRMTGQWAELLRLFSTEAATRFDPESEPGRMAFMAAYNMDEFRKFILNSSFLKRYSVKQSLRVRIGSDDTALLMLGMAWIRLFIFNTLSGEIAIRKKGGF